MYATTQGLTPGLTSRGQSKRRLMKSAQRMPRNQFGFTIRSLII